MRCKTIVAIAVAGVIAAGCGSEEPSGRAAGGDGKVEVENASAPAGRHTDCTMLTQQQTVELVGVDQNAFAPDCIVMRSDALLKVRNVGFREHTVTVSEGEFGTAPWLFNLEVKGGKTEDSVEPMGEFLEPGTYEFFCKFHAGMDGTLQIVEPVG